MGSLVRVLPLSFFCPSVHPSFLPFCRFRTLPLRGFRASPLRGFRASPLRGFRASPWRGFRALPIAWVKPSLARASGPSLARASRPSLVFPSFPSHSRGFRASPFRGLRASLFTPRESFARVPRPAIYTGSFAFTCTGSTLSWHELHALPSSVLPFGSRGLELLRDITTATGGRGLLRLGLPCSDWPVMGLALEKCWGQ